MGLYWGRSCQSDMAATYVFLGKVDGGDGGGTRQSKIINLNLVVVVVVVVMVRGRIPP